MTWYVVLIAFGAVAAILNFVTNIINTFLAIRRTKIQADLYKWKREQFDKEHPNYRKDRKL